MPDMNALRERAGNIRRRIVRLTGTKGVGHTGGSMSMADIMAVLYFHTLRVDPAAPGDPRRDRFILSKGHVTPGYYSTLCERGYFPEAALFEEYDEINGHFQGHPDMNKTPGVDMSTGSLGQGLSVGVGMALGLHRHGYDSRVFVMMGDGEMQEGQIWEAILYAGARKVRNLVAIVDNNALQLTAPTEQIVGMRNLAGRVAGFGWTTLECDGHDVEALVSTLDRGCEVAADGPVLIVANTVKGKGVSFMEGQVAWHSKACNATEMQAALKELE